MARHGLILMELLVFFVLSTHGLRGSTRINVHSSAGIKCNPFSFNESRIQRMLLGGWRPAIPTMIPPSIPIPHVTKFVSTKNILSDLSRKNLKSRLDKEFWAISFPAFLGLAAEPLVSIFDGVFIGRLGTVEQAGVGIAASAQYSVAKLYNDPLLKTTTSMVANKKEKDLSSNVSTAILAAVMIGLFQSLLYVFLAGPLLGWMNVSPTSEMRLPALTYMKWRALGVPASTLLLVCNGIFRGRGDTKTPLYCTTAGNLLNLVLSPWLIFYFGMGVAGAGAASSISQWATVLPILFMLHNSIPFDIFSIRRHNFWSSIQPYFKAGGLIIIRTLAKVAALSATSSAAAQLGTTVMAAYTLTYTLLFSSSQLCEALGIASQALLARDIPFDSAEKRVSAKHVMKRALQAAVVLSGTLALITLVSTNSLLAQLTQSPDVRAAALQIMPLVALGQFLTGVASATGGILLGGFDWKWSTAGMVIAAVLSVSLARVLPHSLLNIWVSVEVFILTQIICAAGRVASRSGPWEGLKIFPLLKLPRGQDGDEEEEKMM